MENYQDERTLPCPFCGAVPDTRKALNMEAWAVICANFESGCEIMPRTKWCVGEDAKETAINTWNKRVNA